MRYKTENKTENTALPLYGPMVQSLAKAWCNALHKSSMLCVGLTPHLAEGTEKRSSRTRKGSEQDKM